MDSTRVFPIDQQTSRDRQKAAARQKFTLAPVPDFLLDYDLLGDLKYKSMTFEMTDRDKEYAKARVVSSTATDAMILITVEDITRTQAKDMATGTQKRFEKSARSQNLVKYLKKLYDDDLDRRARIGGPPLTLEEVLSKMEITFRETTDPRYILDLGKEIIKMRCLDRNIDTSATDDIEIDPEFLASLESGE